MVKVEDDAGVVPAPTETALPVVVEREEVSATDPGHRKQASARCSASSMVPSAMIQKPIGVYG